MTSNNAYEQRKAARIERLKTRAEKSHAESERRFDAARAAVAGIPPGQPILVGHHSEGRHRAALSRHDTNMRKAIDADKQAATLAGRAAAAEANTAISSDDPAAADKLTAKIAAAEKRRAAMKAVNAAHKKFLKKPESLDATDLTEATKKQIREYVPAYSWEPHPFAPYQFSNLGANIRRMKQRLTSLAQAPTETKETETPAGVRIVENAAENRLQMFFPGKPPADVRATLKSAGFRWSPRAGAWQRQLNNAARWASQRVLAQLPTCAAHQGTNP